MAWSRSRMRIRRSASLTRRAHQPSPHASAWRRRARGTRRRHAPNRYYPLRRIGADSSEGAAPIRSLRAHSWDRIRGRNWAALGCTVARERIAAAGSHRSGHQRCSLPLRAHRTHRQRPCGPACCGRLCRPQQASARHGGCTSWQRERKEMEVVKRSEEEPMGRSRCAGLGEVGMERVAWSVDGASRVRFTLRGRSIEPSHGGSAGTARSRLNRSPPHPASARVPATPRPRSRGSWTSVSGETTGGYCDHGLAVVASASRPRPSGPSNRQAL